MKKLSLTLTIIFSIFLLSDVAFSKNIFETDEYNLIINNLSGTSRRQNQKKKVVFTIGELGRFEMGHTGIHKEKKYIIAANPETRLEINGIMGEWFALGAGGSLYISKIHNSVGIDADFKWSAGPSVYFYIAMGRKVMPYFGCIYFYNHVENLQEIGGIQVTSKVEFHSMEGTGGLCFMTGDSVGLFFGYSYVYEMYITSSDKGAYHKASIGLKIFL